MIKLRLMEAFPVNFTDLAPPPAGSPNGMTGAECYAPTGTPTGFNPLSLIPGGQSGKPGKRRYLGCAYQTLALRSQRNSRI